MTDMSVNGAPEVKSSADHGDVQDAFGPMWGIPVSVMINRQGLVCQKHVGLPSKTELEKEIKGLL